ESGRQKWVFQKVGDNLFNIQVSAGVDGNKKYLSCTPDGRMDIYEIDDQVGRQRWLLEALPDGTFHIKVSDGMNAGLAYLSCTADGGLVDVYSQDDGTGRQRWRLIPEDIEIEEIEWDLDKAICVPKPDHVCRQEVGNNSEVEQSSKFTFSKKASETSSFQREHGFTFGVKVKKQWGKPGIVSGSLEVSLSTSHNFKYGQSQTEVDTRTYEMPVKVPPRSRVVAKATVTMIKMDVPYTAWGYSPTTGEKVKCSGVWTGVSAGELNYSIEQL
ncbi:MAG: ETX/MTX2 family pore-forming toxin, partial [Bacteroidota bacterium]